MTESKESVWVVALKVAVAVAPAFLLLYQEHQEFRWAVDREVSQVRYRLRLASWRWRVWRRMDGPQRERYVQLHGAPDGD